MNPLRRAWRAAPLALSAVLSASLLLLFFLPLVALFDAVPGGWGAILQEAGQPEFDASLGFTAYASLLAVLISIIGGVPLGYLLARKAFPGKNLLRSLATVPIVLPHLIAGLAIFLLFAPFTPLSSSIRSTFHVAWPPTWFPVFDTIWGVVLVMVYVSAPYLIIASEIAFRTVDEQVVEAARSLGATPSEVVASITLPLAARGLVAGALLAWARAVSEIGGLLIIAYTVYGYSQTPYNGTATQPVSVLIYALYQNQLGQAEAAACVLVLVAFVVFLGVRLLERGGYLLGAGPEAVP